uniref:Uncharacterized protein n=1 Tax=Anguilla anguilla TaxID=7936 RepID=A0A0E9QYC1_ANGAN
MTEKRVSSFSK